MKKSIFAIVSAIIINCIFNITNSQAQWEPDVRLTDNIYDSYTSFNSAWCIAAKGDSIHVCWYDSRDGNFEIYYKRSVNGGLNWSSDARLTNNSESSYRPAIAVSDSVVHVVWYDARDANWEIYYKRSTDGGLNWGTDRRLTNNTSTSYSPSIAVNGDFVYIVWYDQRNGNWEIYYKRSADGGTTWGSDIRMTNNSAYSYNPSVAVSGLFVNIVWYDQRDGNYEVYFKRSTDAGLNWGSDTRLTNNSSSSLNPSVAVSGSVVHIVWDDLRDGNEEIYYKRSTDNGVNWSGDTRLTYNSSLSFFPSIAVSGSVIHIVWVDQRDGNNELYYKQSADSGTNWNADTRLTNKETQLNMPSVAVSDSVVHCLWYDQRDGNNEIYYKKRIPGEMFLNLTVLISGFFDGSSGFMQMCDTVSVCFRNISSPYDTVYSAIVCLDSLGKATFEILNVPKNSNKYIVINHRNSLETWSNAGGVLFDSSYISYTDFDFTTDSSKAYGNNMIKIGSKWCIINGDCNRDDYIDGGDYLEIFNHYDESGYLKGDTNGDNYIDGSDYLAIFNNYDIGMISPLTYKLKSAKTK